MKIIKYDLLQSIVEDDETGVETPITLEVEMPWSEAAELLAKEEAYNGVYEIYDDGTPEPAQEASTDDVLNILLGVAE